MRPFWVCGFLFNSGFVLKVKNHKAIVSKKHRRTFLEIGCACRDRSLESKCVLKRSSLKNSVVGVWVLHGSAYVSEGSWILVVCL